MSDNNLEFPVYDKNPQRQGNLEGPLMLIGGNGEQFLVVHERDVDNPMADAQLFDVATGVLLDQIKPLGIWLKFLYLMEGIIPPVAFTEAEAQHRVRIYEAAKRARLAAAAEEDGE